MRKIICLLLGMMAGTVPATIMIPQSVEALTAQAQTIVQGTVLSRSCQRDAEGRIYTAVEFAVAEVWKGALATNRITLVHGGGVLGTEKAVVVGQVNYAVGEAAVVFLVWNSRGQPVTLGLCQGKFKITKDPATGAQQVDNGVLGRAASPAVAGVKALAVPAGHAPLTLAELKQRVKGE